MSLPAHDLEATTVAAVLRADGSFVVEITADLDALLLAAGAVHDSVALSTAVAALPAPELAARLEKLQGLFQRRLRVRFDGEPAPFTVSFPDRRTDAAAGAAAASSYLGLRARLSGRSPHDWRELTFWASRAFQQVDLTVVDAATGRSVRHQLEVGEESPPFERVTESPPRR